MSRQKRNSQQTPLMMFLRRLLKEQDLTPLKASRIAGCSPSVFHGWLQGSYPSESVNKLKCLANHFGYSLAYAISGTPDEIGEDDKAEIGITLFEDATVRIVRFQRHHLC